MTIFGTTNYIIEGTTLITVVDKNRCKDIIPKLSRMPFILNGRRLDKSCSSKNVIVIPNFFLPDLLNTLH